MKNPLNIAYINHASDMGGAEHLLLNLLKNLPHADIHPLLICSQDGRLIHETKQLNIQTEIIKLPKFISISWVIGNRKILNPFAFIWNGICIIIAANVVNKNIRSRNIDLIQTNTLLTHIYGGLAARQLNIPCIWYFHDLVEERRLAGVFGLTWRFLARILPSSIVADSKAVLSHLRSNDLGTVIYPCIDEDIEVSHDDRKPLVERLKLPKESILVGSIGRISFSKGLDLLIDAARIVVNDNPNIHFVIFGGALFGEDKYKIQLEKKVVRYGISNHWHWMGYDELAKEYLRELDYIISPSRREAFGLALVEAGYLGKAAISTNIGGIPEIIEHGITGVIITPENHKLLAKAILELAIDPQYVIFLGENAKKRVTKLFNRDRYIFEFLQFYNQIIS